MSSSDMRIEKQEVSTVSQSTRKCEAKPVAITLFVVGILAMIGGIYLCMAPSCGGPTCGNWNYVVGAASVIVGLALCVLGVKAGRTLEKPKKELDKPEEKGEEKNVDQPQQLLTPPMQPVRQSSSSRAEAVNSNFWSGTPINNPHVVIYGIGNQNAQPLVKAFIEAYEEMTIEHFDGFVAAFGTVWSAFQHSYKCENQIFALVMVERESLFYAGIHIDCKDFESHTIKISHNPKQPLQCLEQTFNGSKHIMVTSDILPQEHMFRVDKNIGNPDSIP